MKRFLPDYSYFLHPSENPCGTGFKLHDGIKKGQKCYSRTCAHSSMYMFAHLRKSKRGSFLRKCANFFIELCFIYWQYAQQKAPKSCYFLQVFICHLRRCTVCYCIYYAHLRVSIHFNIAHCANVRNNFNIANCANAHNSKPTDLNYAFDWS